MNTLSRPIESVTEPINSLKNTLGTLRRQGQMWSERRAERRAKSRAARRAENARRQEFELQALPHMDALFNYARRMTGSQVDAEDLLQETYLKAYRFFDKFEPGTNCKAWLFRILKNSYINRYRRDRKSPETTDFDVIEDFQFTIGAESHDEAAELFKNVLDDEIAHAIERLPEDFRTVVILCDIEDFSYEEIAEFVDCPVGTVRSRLHRGRRLLREMLCDYAAERGYPAELEMA